MVVTEPIEREGVREREEEPEAEKERETTHTDLGGHEGLDRDTDRETLRDTREKKR